MEHRFVVIWTRESRTDLEDIFDFLAKDSITAAGNVVGSILDREQQLAQVAESGPVQPTFGTRFTYRYLVEGNYKIIFHLSGSTVYVDTVFDTRQHPGKMRLK